MNKSKLLLLVVVIALIAVFFAFDLGRYFSLDYFRTQQAAINGYYQANPTQTIAIYFLIYVAIAAFSLPAKSPYLQAGEKGRRVGAALKTPK